MAPQLTATNGPLRRGESWWIAWAQSSLPVPLSPARRRVLDHVVDRTHRQRRADQAVEFAFLRNLGRRDQCLQLPAFERVAHRYRQAIRRERLHDEIVGAFAHRLDRDLDRAMRGDDDDGAGEVARADAAQDVEAVDVG
jgi:hypothetical protein